MPKIINDGAVKYGTSMLAETNNGYFIYNNYYYNDLNTYPFEIASISGRSEQLQTKMNSMLRILPEISRLVKGKYIQNIKPLTVIDNENQSIFYSVYCNYSSKINEISVIKYSEDKENGINVFQTSYLGSNTAGGSYNFLQPYAIFGQTSKYIIIGCSFKTGTNVDSNAVAFLKYEKATGILTALNKTPTAYTPTMATPLISNEKELYYYYQQYSSYEIYKLDIESGANTNIYSSGTKSYINRFLDNVKKIDENRVEFTSLNSDAYSPVSFKKIELDIGQSVDSNKTKISNITVTYNEKIKDSFIPLAHHIGLMYHTFEYTATNGNTYFNLAVYTCDHNYDGKAFEGIYTFKKNADGSLEAKDYTLFSSSYFTTGFLLAENKNWFITGSEYNVSSYYFDEIQERYIKKNDFNVPNPISMGLDKNDKIWIIDGAYKLHCFSQGIGKDIDLKLDRQSYKFEGETIQGTVSITCKNYEGVNTANDLILTINGPAVFTDNGMKNIRVSVTEEQPLVVPITIKNSGNITVSSKIVQ